MNNYLASTTYIDWQHPEVFAQAKVLANASSDGVIVAKNCFEFVRDEIKHSLDYKLNPVTCKAMSPPLMRKPLAL